MKLLQPITELEQVNPDWLTRTLHEKGYLPFGRVGEVRQERIYSNNAFAASLRLSCSEETPQSAPGRLFVKIARHQRLIGGQGVTLVHRDTHLLNILYPNQPQTDAVRLVDWQSWWVDTGTNDLAYMMAVIGILSTEPDWSDLYCNDIGAICRLTASSLIAGTIAGMITGLR